MTKGSGMIEPMMATMLGFLTCDAQVEPALLTKRFERSRPRHVQRDHRRRRMLDQRYRLRPRQRRERRRDRRDSLYPALEAGLRAVPGSSPSVSSAAARARPSSSRSWSRARTNGHMPSARPARSRTRCLSKPRYTAEIRTGVVSSRRQDARACPSISRARACASAASCCSRTASRTTPTPRRPPHICRAKTSTSKSTSAPAGREQATIWTCDLSADYVKINADYRT